jgi:hypothetical protein
LTTLTAAEAAETVSIRVVSLADQSVGVRSAILADDEGEMKVKARTDRTGAATLSVRRCDEALGIRADPMLPYLPSGRFDCSTRLTIPVGLPRFAGALEPALADAAAAEPPFVQASVENPLSGVVDVLRRIFGTATRGLELPASPPSSTEDNQATLRRALEAQDDAAAARAAAALAAEARSARGDPALASSYEALAAAAAFRAIGLEPGDPARPLLGTADGGAALTPAGRRALVAFQTEAGVAATGTWTAETLARLPGGG